MDKVYIYKMDKGKLQPLSFTEPEKRVERVKDNELIEHPVSKYMLAKLADSDPTHRSCIDLKTSLISTLGYKTSLEEGKKKETLKKFLKSPNQIPFQTFQDVLNNFVEDIETFADGFLEFVKSGDGVAVYHVNAKDIWIKPRKSGEKVLAGIPEKYYQISSKGTVVEFEPYLGELEEGIHYLAHFKNYSPSSSFYGVPKYLASFGAIAESTLIRKFGIKFFENDARPGIVITVAGGTISDEAEAKIKEGLSKDFKSVENAHKALLIIAEEEGVKIDVKEIGSSLDGDFLKQSDKNRDEVARVHQIAPKLLGISASGSLGSGSETIGSLKDLIEKLIKPKQKRVAGFVNLILEALFGFDPYLTFNVMDLTTAKDDAVIWNLLSKIVDKNGKPVLSVDEIREVLNMPEKIKGEGMAVESPKESTNNNGDARTGEDTQANPDDMNNLDDKIKN